MRDRQEDPKSQYGDNKNELDEAALKKMRESLDFLDRSVEVKKPDLLKLVELVNEVEEKKASSNNRQFLTFLVTALLVIGLETYSFTVSLGFFIAVQAAAVIFTIPAVLSWNRKRNRQVTGNRQVIQK